MENRDAIDTDEPSDTKAPQPSGAKWNAAAAPDDGATECERGALGSLWDLDGLIDAARAGDPPALNRLLAHARPRLLAVALRMLRDRDDAEDVVQEALLKVCRHLTRFEGRSAFSTWLHRILVNAALDRLRRHPARWERTLDGEHDEGPPAASEPVDEETPERLVARAETGAAVQGAIACLSERHQEVLALRELNGESYQAISRIARVPVGTVMSRLHHARRRLAEELAATFEPAALRAA
jgi:RNA polymerase sigma-70 factor (ECF subfamily)